MEENQPIDGAGADYQYQTPVKNFIFLMAQIGRKIEILKTNYARLDGIIKQGKADIHARKPLVPARRKEYEAAKKLFPLTEVELAVNMHVYDGFVGSLCEEDQKHIAAKLAAALMVEKEKQTSPEKETADATTE